MNEEYILILKDGRKLGYAEYGDPQGKPLMFFHGWPSSRLQARITDEIAKELHIRVISLDRPGFGLSDFQKTRTLLDWPTDVAELADKLSIDTFAILGISGGGPYAAVCGYKIPKRLTKVGIVAGLAPTYIPGLLDGMPLFSKLGWANYAKFPMFRTVSVLIHFAYAKYSPQLGLHRFLFGAKRDKQLLSDLRVRQFITRNFQEAFQNGYQGVKHDLKLYTSDWGFSVKDIPSKVLLFYGEEDKNVPLAMGKYYASQIKGSKLTLYQNEGHFILSTHMEEIFQKLC